jgi:hypothetical protein
VDMSDSDASTALTITLGPAQVAAIDGWIARHDEPKPTREDAVCQLITARLGAEEEHPSTVIPNLVTGRDIV